MFSGGVAREYQDGEIKDGQIEIRLSGTGGQGLILAGIILAEAAMSEGKNVVQSQSYGPESRGGASKAEVIISDRAVHFPEVIRPDILLVMSQPACDRHCGDVRGAGVQIVDTYYVRNYPTGPGRVYAVPISQIAREDLGAEIYANIVGLGALQAVTHIVGEESLAAAVAARVPPKTLEQNSRALRLGMEAGAAARPLAGVAGG